jgi:hypothetical protein
LHQSRHADGRAREHYQSTPSVVHVVQAPSLPRQRRHCSAFESTA